jgi:hypothetical protein
MYKKAYDLRNEVQLPRSATGTACKEIRKDTKRVYSTELVQLQVLRSSQLTIKCISMT